MIEAGTVDDQGNISYVRGEGILLLFRERDGTGALVDPGTHPRWLNIPALSIRREVGIDSSDPTYYRLTITPDELSAASRVGGVAFSITDEQNVIEGVTYPIALWSGTIRERNLFL